ncbi:MAG: hypothetical protein ACPLX8_01310, partial [Nanopusillaceae archaeon]
ISYTYGSHLIYMDVERGFQVTNHHRGSPYSGIKVHTRLNYKIYKVLIDKNFINLLLNGWIFGFKLYDFSYPKLYKQLTIYIGFKEIHGYYYLLHLFRRYKIKIKPKLAGKEYQYVWLNRLHISKDIFIRYSTDLYDRLGGNWKISDNTWRSAEDHNHPSIFALSRNYLLKNFYSIINNLEAGNEIYTIITLQRAGGIVLPVPEIIINFDWNKFALMTYNIFDNSYYTYRLYDHNDLIYLDNHILRNISIFLARGHL